MCDTFAIVERGRVLFGKNSDRDPNEAQLLEWHPKSEHGPGTRLRCTWIEIPQVRLTYAILISRPFWMWGAEMGANEHGVVIGNEAVFTRQPLAKTGLTGMDLLRLALERSTDAKSAVRTIIELLETHGQGGGCGHEHPAFRYHNSFLVADPGSAVVLETAGRYWATEPVLGARSISNVLTIPDFAAKHSNRLRSWVSGGELRRPRTQCLAEQARSAAQVASILRDHGDGAISPRYSPLNGGLHSPCVHAGGFIASSQTAASWISELSLHGARHWATGTAAPCCSIFRPVDVSQPLDLGPPPTDVADGRSLWWRGERLHRRAIRQPQTFLPLLGAKRLPIESQLFADPPPSAQASAIADGWLKQCTQMVAKQQQALGGSDARPGFVRRYWRRRNRRSHLDPDSALA